MKTCPHCNTKFDPKYNQQVYCTPQCGYAAYRARKNAKRVQRMLKCGCCGKQFKPGSSNSKYCSHACTRQIQAQRDAIRYAERRALKQTEDRPNASDFYSVTDPYGSHLFDWWVKCSMEGAGACSRV